MRARREVILCAGTVNTARLLQVSGVGPAALLGELGVPVVHEVRGVGENFRDHYASRFVMRAKPGVRTLNQLARGLRLGAEVARWGVGRPTILATAPSHVHVFWKSFEGLDAPDLQCVFTPGSYAEGKVYVLDDYPGVTAGAWQHRPESTGWVRARSADVFEDPEIQPNYLSDPIDRRVHLGGIRLLRRMLSTPELAPFLEAETLPGPAAQTDDELLDFAFRNGTTTYHLIGTARMGPATDPTAVVDDRLLVHGMEALRVADASIMPHMPVRQHLRHHPDDRGEGGGHDARPDRSDGNRGRLTASSDAAGRRRSHERRARRVRAYVVPGGGGGNRPATCGVRAARNRARANSTASAVRRSSSSPKNQTCRSRRIASAGSEAATASCTAWARCRRSVSAAGPAPLNAKPATSPCAQHRRAGWDVPSANLSATTSGSGIGAPKRTLAPPFDMFSTMQSMPTPSNTTWARFRNAFRASRRISSEASAVSAAGASPTVLSTSVLQFRGPRATPGPGPIPAGGYACEG